MDDLLALAGRCEQATGPDRELDFFIAVRLDPEWSDLGDNALGNYATYGTQPAYTASLDAAMTLVPEGLRKLLDEQPSHWIVTVWLDSITPVATGKAATAALALCAAALRARAAVQGSSSLLNEGGE